MCMDGRAARFEKNGGKPAARKSNIGYIAEAVRAAAGMHEIALTAAFSGWYNALYPAARPGAAHAIIKYLPGFIKWFVAGLYPRASA